MFVWLSRIVVLALVVAVPWANGAVDPVPRWWLSAGVVLALGLLLLGRLFRREDPVGWPLLPLLPLALGLLLGLAQLVPSASLGPLAVSTTAAEWRQELSDNSTQQASNGRSAGLSLSAAATRADLALLMLGTGCLVLGCELFRHPPTFFLFCMVNAVNGAAVALFGIVSRLSSNGKLYWRIEIPDNNTLFGPFVYHNLGGSYLAICLACVLVLLIRMVADSGSRRSFREHRRPAMQQALEAGRRFLAQLNFVRLSLICFSIFIAAGLLFSLSRGALLAFLAAVLAMAGATARWRHTRIGIGMAAAGLVGAVIFLSAYGVMDPVTQRLESLFRAETLQTEGRLSHWRDILSAVPDHWLLGAGLGTYRYLHQQYLTAFDELRWEHAHNEYLEAMVEGGVPALLLLVGELIILLLTIRRLLHRQRLDVRLIGLAGLLVIVSQAVHATVDYCLHLPVMTVLVALVSGALIGADATRRAPHGPRGWILHGRGGQLLLLLLVTVGCLWSASEHHAISASHNALRQLPWDQPARELDRTLVETHIQQLQQVLQRRPDDAELHEALVELHVIHYRLGACDQLSVETGMAADDPQLWEWTAPVVLHHRAHTFRRQGNSASLQELRQLVLDSLQPAVHHALAARQACPLLSKPHVHLEEFEFLLDAPRFDGEHLQRARRVEPANPELLYEVGHLHFSAGRYDAAYAAWRESLGYSPRFRENIILLAEQHLTTEEVIEQVLPADPALLLMLAEGPYATEARQADRDRLLQQALQCLTTTDELTAEQFALRARIHQLFTDGDPLQAIEDYRQALRRDPANVPWRYTLAQLLLAQGQLPEAEREAQLCARLKPHRSLYRHLLSEIREARQQESSDKREL